MAFSTTGKVSTEYAENPSNNQKYRVFKSAANAVQHLRPNHTKNEPENDLFVNFRGLIILGRILGIIPLSGVWGKSYKNLECRLLTAAGMLSFFCLTIITLNLVISIGNAIKLEKHNIIDIAKSFGGPLGASRGLFIYAFYMYNRQDFVNIFSTWTECTRNLVYTKTDKHLDHTVAIISGVMFTSAVLENAAQHLEFFQYFDDINGHTMRWGKDTSNASIIEIYYRRSHVYLHKMIGYHPIYGGLAFILNKWLWYGWNYAALLAAFFFRALYFKFKALCEMSESHLLNDQQTWNQIAKDHEALCQILKSLNDFFSPFVFASYSFNIYAVCMQLLFGLNPEEVQNSLVHTIYKPWSFIHATLRIFIFSYFAAKVNEWAHKINEVIMRCPPELYNGHIIKLERLVNGRQELGLSGLGCFTITKPFMLGILNVVFTIEIVLLQGLAADTSSSSLSC